MTESGPPRSPMPPSTGCCTTLTASKPPARASANARRPNSPLDLLNRPHAPHLRPAVVPRHWPASNRTPDRHCRIRTSMPPPNHVADRSGTALGACPSNSLDGGSGG